MQAQRNCGGESRDVTPDTHPDVGDGITVILTEAEASSVRRVAERYADDGGDTSTALRRGDRAAARRMMCAVAFSVTILDQVGWPGDGRQDSYALEVTSNVRTWLVDEAAGERAYAMRERADFEDFRRTGQGFSGTLEEAAGQLARIEQTATALAAVLRKIDPALAPAGLLTDGVVIHEVVVQPDDREAVKRVVQFLVGDINRLARSLEEWSLGTPDEVLALIERAKLGSDLRHAIGWDATTKAVAVEVRQSWLPLLRYALAETESALEDERKHLDDTPDPRDGDPADDRRDRERTISEFEAESGLLRRLLGQAA